MTARVYNSPSTTTNIPLGHFRHTSPSPSPVVVSAEGLVSESSRVVITNSTATTSLPVTDMSLYDGGRREDTNNSEEILARRRNASRNLFGAPTVASAQYARNKLRELLERESARWNFDFETEKPLPGRFRWEPVEDKNPSILPVQPSKSTSVVIPVRTKITQETSALSGPSQPKQRRVEATVTTCTIRDPFLVVSTSSSPVQGSVPSTPTLNSVSVDLKRKSPIPSVTTASSSSYLSTKLLFPPSTTTATAPTASGGTTPPPSPPQSMIPATVLVTATAVDPLDDASRKYLSTDSGRRKEKQMKITMYSAVKKRRIGHGTAGTEKKAAF